MLKISIISVGKIKEKYIKLGIDEFSKRLSRYAKLEIIELNDEKAPENLSPRDMEIIKNTKIAISICTLFVLPAKISELDLKYMSRLGLAYSF